MPSKLGPHVIRPTPEAVDWARVAPVAKALDDTTALRVAARATVRIFRRYFPDQNVGVLGGAIVDAVLASLGDAPATHVELYNETAQRLGQGLERYVDFTAEAVRRLKERRPDLVLVAFCFSTGNPDRDDWEYLRQREYGGASVVGLHQYWGPGGFTPWHALRHRTAHAWTGGDHPPFLITECGRDRAEGGNGGWRADGLTEQQYLAELRAYETEILRDPYVIAATPFTGGPTPDWAAFDTDPLSGRLAALSGPLPDPPPEVPTVPDIKLSVPTRESLASPDNYQKGPRQKTIGVVVHTTRGGGRPENEFSSTIAWFANPDAGVSAHLVVGHTPFDEVARCVHDDDIAWHARTANQTHLSIEICQAKIGDPITPFQYEAAAEAVRLWAAKYKFPVRRVKTITQPGIVGHEDSEPGKLDGKTDPGPLFDWDRFIKLAGGQTVPPNPTPKPAPTLPSIDAERDALWGIADRLERAGWKWFGQGVKALVAMSKGER